MHIKRRDEIKYKYNFRVLQIEGRNIYCQEKIGKACFADNVSFATDHRRSTDLSKSYHMDVLHPISMSV